jgi:MFS transporter, DHA2 family, metal-tetracycline-proton antiporter
MNAGTTGGRRPLFAMAFAAITATSFCFVLRAMVIDDWGAAFSLSETQKGEILGAGLWPFAITIVLLSLVIDRLGFKRVFWVAVGCHVAGLATLVTASGYWPLYIGTFMVALGNGAVEAAANPLVATLYNEDKPRWLNRLHAAWPLGLMIGGLLAIGFGDLVEWQIKIALMAIPIMIYAGLLTRIDFPVSERVAAGVSYREMLAEAGYLSAFIILSLMCVEVGRVADLPGGVVIGAIALLTAAYAFYARSPGQPLYIALVLVMIPLAITELSTDSWIVSLMEPELSSWGLNAGWVLVYTSAIMFVVRLFAGSIVRIATPLGTLAFASGVAATGLFLLSGATGPALLGAATLYGIGKSFFWGTSLAIASERFPKGGAVTVNILAGAGMLAAGIIGASLLGSIQDRSTERGLAAHDRSYGTHFSATYLSAPKRGVFGEYRGLDTASIERAPQADRAAIARIVTQGKKGALREVALLPVLTLLIYLGLILYFRARGGYRPVELSKAGGTA